MKNKKWKDIREIPANGKPKWYGGAYTLAFVYSNKGNILLKGYNTEVREYLRKLKSDGYKFIVNETMWHVDSWTNKKKFRSIWRTSGNGTYISAPDPKFKNDPSKLKWVIENFDSNDRLILKFKRLPKRWVSEFDKVIF